MTIRITDSQMRAIMNPARLLGIKGCAGSGKSLVAVLRAIRQHMLDQGRVLILAYNKPLISYLKGLARADDYAYPEMQLSLGDIGGTLLPTDLSEIDVAAVVTTINYDAFGVRLLGGIRPPEDGGGLAEGRLLEEAIKVAGIPGQKGAHRLRLQIERAGIVGARTQDEARGMLASFRGMTEANLSKVFEVRNAWLAKLRSQRLAGSWNEIPLLLRQLIEDQALAPGKYQFRHIVLDEVQDFTPAWLRLIKDHMVEPGGTLTVVGDAAQTLYPRLGRVSVFPYRVLGLPRSGSGSEGERVVSLADRSHRLAGNPAARRLARWWFDMYLAGHIDNDSQERLGADDPSGVVAYTCFRSNEKPLAAESLWVLQRAQGLLKTGSVAIMLPAAETRAGLSEEWRDAIKATGAMVRVLKEEVSTSADAVTFWGGDSRSHIWFVSYRYAKGAEWDHVIVPRLSDWAFGKNLDGFAHLVNEITDDDDEPRESILNQALYVTFTRARVSLEITCPFQHSGLFEKAPVERRAISDTVRQHE